MNWIRLTAIAQGISAYGEAFKLMRTHGLRYFYLFPLLLTILLIVSGWQGTSWLTSTALDTLHQWSGMENWQFWGSQVLTVVVKWSIWIFFRLLFFLTLSYVGGYIIIMLMSPVYSWLSEKCTHILTGHTQHFSLSNLINSVIRGIFLALRNLLIELGLTILLIILGFIPIVGLISAPSLLAVTSYFYGFSFLDYTLEQYRLGIRRSTRTIMQHKGEALGVGLPFTLVLSIPFIGSFIAAFLSVPAVVAATIVAHRDIAKNENVI